MRSLRSLFLKGEIFILPNEDAWLFIAYEMYCKGLTKEEVDNLDGFTLIMEFDSFEKWRHSEMPLKK